MRRVQQAKSARRRNVLGVIVAALVTLPAAPAHALIIADLIRVGYPLASGDAVRAGCWVSVVVDLHLQNQPIFSGYLRLRQVDRDGDAYIDMVPVNLHGEEGGAHRRYTLYTVAGQHQRRDNEYRVELLATDEDNSATAELVHVVTGGSQVPSLSPSLPPQIIPDEELMILDVSEGVLGKVRYLMDYSEGVTFVRPPRVAHVAPRDLPAQWIGLQMIDVVLWDEADPTQITPAQLEALLEWVRQGGTLVLAAARTSDAIAQSDVLAPLLPVIIGPLRTVTHLSVADRILVSPSDQPQSLDNPYATPIAVAACQLIDVSEVYEILHEDLPDGPLASVRRVGRGRLIYLAASLHDLLAPAKEINPVKRFFRQLLWLRDSAGADQIVSAHSLFTHMERETAFSARSGVFLIAAILFVAVYVLASTFGVWYLLGNRDRLKHSWTAFAICALGACAISIAGVSAIRLGGGVHQLCVIDGDAGSAEARGTGYFGLTTSLHSRVDAWLPEDALLSTSPQVSACFLNPMPTARDRLGQSSFTDPATYELRPNVAMLTEVPIRATLKQFEGRWSGLLRGTIQASLTMVDRLMPRNETAEDSVNEWVMASDSWLQNDLGEELHDCLLVIADRDIYDPKRFSGWGPRGERVPDAIMVFSLGTIADSERIDLFRRLYLDKQGLEIPASKRENWTLHNYQKTWGRPFVGLSVGGFGEETIRYDQENHGKAILLATLYSDLDPLAFQSAVGGYTRFDCNHCRHLDLSDRLTTRQALFIGFTETAGPMRLCTRTGGGEFERRDPERARTVYRFMIPVSWQE